MVTTDAKFFLKGCILRHNKWMYVCACTCTFEQLSERQKAFPESEGLNCLQLKTIQGFPRGLSGKESTCLCRRHRRLRFDPWIRKIPWKRSWRHTPAFLPAESHDGGAWRATVHRVSRSQTGLSTDTHQTTHVPSGIFWGRPNPLHLTSLSKAFPVTLKHLKRFLCV